MAKSKTATDGGDEEITPFSEANPIPPEAAGGGAMDADKPPPPFGSPKPVGAGDVPRVVNPLSRVDKGSGYSRFKIACRNHGAHKTLHILAASEDQARKHYLSVTKLDALLARIKKNGGEVEPPDLAITELPD